MTEQELRPQICSYCGYHRVNHGSLGQCDEKFTKDMDGNPLSRGNVFTPWTRPDIAEKYVQRAKADLCAVMCGDCGAHQKKHFDPSYLHCQQMWSGFKSWPVSQFFATNLLSCVRAAMSEFPEEFGLLKAPVHSSVPFKMRRNCECGAWTMGVQDGAFGHSTWCRVASKTLPKDLLR